MRSRTSTSTDPPPPSGQLRTSQGSTPDDLMELARSYDDHLRSFEAELDKQTSVARSPKKRAPSITSKTGGLGAGTSAGSPTQAASKQQAQITRANSHPEEVIFGFTPSRQTGSSPDESEMTDMPAMAAADKVFDVPATKKPLDPVAAAPAPVAATAKAPATAKPPTQTKSVPAAERGPKVDVKSLSKEERRALSKQQQDKAKAKKQPASGGAADAGKKGDAAGKRGDAPAAASASSKAEPKKRDDKKTGGATPPVSKPADGKRKDEGTSKKGAAGAGSSSSASSSASAAAAASALQPSPAAGKRVYYFMHLPEWTPLPPPYLDSNSSVHPEIVRLGYHYSQGSIRGSSARCAALVKGFESVLHDYALPPKTEFSKHFYEMLQPNIRFLSHCRPKAVSMGNLIRAFKNKITQCRGKGEQEGKACLQQFLAEFIDERLLWAQEIIVKKALPKIVDGDEILTYCFSFVILQLLLEAHQMGKKFSVVVVDGGEGLEGKQMLERLSSAGISCTYILLNAVSYMMKGVSKVLLGAAALLSNGNLVSRVGTTLVAMAAHTYHVPVIVMCETIKFSEKCMLDSITWNELGDPNELNDCAATAQWQDDKSSLTLLSLRYDVCPIAYITMVVCEFGMIPPTSVPVILREHDSTTKAENGKQNNLSQSGVFGSQGGMGVSRSGAAMSLRGGMK